MGFSRNSISVADYHVHCDFSFDAEGTIDDYCQSALAKGLTEICFTTHYDTNPVISEMERMIRIDGKLEPNSPEKMLVYYNTCKEAHQRYYALGLAVKCGVEFAYYPGCEENMRDLFKKVKFHYRLGSIHEVDQYLVCYNESMKKCANELPLNKFADRYFELMKMLVESKLCDAVSHIDMYRLHGLKLYGNDILNIHKGRIEPVFELMKKHDIGFEINTKAVRRGLAEYYPTMAIVNLARSIGARVMAIGSDAHKPEEVAYEFELASALAYDLYPYVDE